MANVVYVGNYPNTLSDEEIIEIFKDFEGLVLLRSVKKNRKCYSFILCQDQEQVIEVVFALNGFLVGGRNLIVRASDDELQEIIDQCEYENDCESNADSDNQINLCHGNGAESSNTNYRQPRKPSRLASAKMASTDSFAKAIVSRDVYNTASWKRNETDSVLSDESSIEISPCYSFMPSRSLSPCSVASSTFTKRRGEKFSFVSVVNFPDGTTTEELSDMFADYNPFKIIIQNQISEEDKPTEAIICFLKDKDATSSIINLDNTLYHGRVILVTECDDVTLISDLVKVNRC